MEVNAGLMGQCRQMPDEGLPHPFMCSYVTQREAFGKRDGRGYHHPLAGEEELLHFTALEVHFSVTCDMTAICCWLVGDVVRPRTLALHLPSNLMGVGSAKCPAQTHPLQVAS